jgi:hypothetical protein
MLSYWSMLALFILLQILLSKDFTTSCLDRAVVTATVKVCSSLFAMLLCLLHASLVVHLPLFLCCGICPRVVYFCLIVILLAILLQFSVGCALLISRELLDVWAVFPVLTLLLLPVVLCFRLRLCVPDFFVDSFVPMCCDHRHGRPTCCSSQKT